MKATKTWTSDIPWQCVEIDHCTNTICPGRTVRGVGCKDNPFYSLSNFKTTDQTAIAAYNTAFATAYPSGYYNVHEQLQAWAGGSTAPITWATYLTTGTDTIPAQDRINIYTFNVTNFFHSVG